MKPIDINPADMDIVLGILRDLAPEIEVRAFGSRVAWSARETSDLDLAMMTNERLPDSCSMNLREAFSESELPFKVDLIDWATTSDNFRKVIEREYVVVQTNEWQKHGSAKSIGSKLPPKDNQEHRSNRSDWISTTVGSFCPFLYGKGLPKNKRNKNGNFKVYGSNGPVGTHDRPLVDGPGIVIGRKGTVGGVHFSPNSFWPIDTTFFVSDETERDLRFTYYLLKSIGLEHMNADSAVPGLNRDAAHAKRIQIPKYSEQQNIAHILGTLDDKSELNRQTNETLEAIARTLFKSWFVDFDPVRAKIEGQPAYLAPEILNLFPNTLDDEDKPMGWTWSEIGDEVTAVGGGTPSTKEPLYWVDGTHAWATPKDLSGLSTLVMLDTAKALTDAGVAKISSGLLPSGTVLMSSRAPIGYLAIAENPTAINQGFIAMRCDKRLSNLYVLFWCDQNMDLIKSLAGGTTFAEISKKNFRPIPVICASPQIHAAFDRICQPLYQQIVANAKECHALAIMRDTLLPQLISGKLQIH